MKICLIGDGNSIHIRRWAGWLKARNHEVSMLSLTRPTDDNGNAYTSIRYVPKILGPLGFFRTALKIRQMVRRESPDVIHGHYLSAAGFYTAFSGWDARVNSVWGSDIYLDTKDNMKRMTAKWTLRHSEVVLADSDALIEEVRKLHPKADLRKVLFGVDTELFKPNPIEHDKFTYLSVRATGGVYNSDVVVKGFEKANLDAILMMQEPMADGMVIKDYVKSKPELDKKIVWYGRRPYDKMPELYNSADVGISIPSWDSSSTAMNESMSCGIPVIASDIPQNHEWIDQSNGLFSPIDADSLALSMRLVHNVSMPNMKANARKKIVKDGDFNTEMLKAERIYQEVLDGKNR